MRIKIDCDKDLEEILNKNPSKHRKLEYLHKIAGYRCYISIGKFDGELFLEIICSTCGSGHPSHLKWKLSANDFVKNARKFGFVDVGYNLFLKRRSDFSIQKENKFLEILLNICHDCNYNLFGKKYGLK